MNVLEMLEQDLSIFETNDQLPALSPLQTDPVDIKINMPSFLRDNKLQNYTFIDRLNLDDESPFNPADLLGSTDCSGRELAAKVSLTNTEPYISLPYFKMGISKNKMQLDLCHSEKYKESVLNEQGTESEKPKLQNNRTDQNKVMQEEQSEPIVNVMTEEDNRIIDSLKISEATKKLIREKYFRTANHPDLAQFKVYEKNPSAVFYEMFSVLHREKPIFDFESTGAPRGPPEYIAYHVFNEERLGIGGKGSSKKEAKNAASFISLQIFAPSLAERCRQHCKSGEDEALKALISGVNQPQEETKQKDQENLKQKEAGNMMEVEEFKENQMPELDFFEKNDGMLFDDKDFDVFHDSSRKYIETLESFDNLDLFFTANKDDILNDFIGNNKKTISPFSIEQEEQESSYKLKKVNQAQKPAPKSGSGDKNPEAEPVGQKEKPKEIKESGKKEQFNIKCDSVNGLKIGMSISNKDMSYNRDILENIKTHGRLTATRKVLDDLLGVLKGDKGARVDPKAHYNPDIGKCLKYYCMHNVFTKLYMLHCLIHKREDQTLQLNALYFDKQCYVYLYASEVEQTFMYQSESFVMSVEMAKYFLIFTLYKQCRTILDIVNLMKAKIEPKKDNIEAPQQKQPLASSQPINQTTQKNITQKTSYSQKENNPKLAEVPVQQKGKPQFLEESNAGLKVKQNNNAPEEISKRSFEEAFEKKPRNKNKKILQSMADDIDSLFQEDRPAKTKPVPVMTIKDQMIEDLDMI